MVNWLTGNGLTGRQGPPGGTEPSALKRKSSCGPTCRRLQAIPDASILPVRTTAVPAGRDARGTYCRDAHGRFRSGFTLVELVVALTLTVLVVGATAGILRSIGGIRQRVDDQGLIRQEARVAVSAIADALANAHRSGDNLAVLEGIDDWGDGWPSDHIRLLVVRRSPVRPGEAESDVKEIEFGLSSGEGQVPMLARRVDPTRNESPDEGGVIEKLAHGIIGLDLHYHDGTQWREDWPKSTAWPVAVRIEMLVVDERHPYRQPLQISRLVSFPAMPTPREESSSSESTGRGEQQSQPPQEEGSPTEAGRGQGEGGR